jgi:Transposase, Mutator family
VPARLSPADRVRGEIDELSASDQPLAEILEQVARLSIRLVLQSALDAEVSVFLGRDRYQRDPDARPGYRNGHQPITVKTTAGPVTLERPKLRGTEVAFASRLLGKHVTRTNALEALVIAGYVRGLSTRDVEAALAEALGPEGGAVEVDRQPRLRGHQGRVRHLAQPQPDRAPAGVPVPGRQPLPHAPRRAGRAGAVRLGHHP